MDSLLVKIFATALTFSQVTVGPDAIKTEFDPVQDQQEVVTLLRAGCAHMRKAFDIESINIDDLIATAMDDPEAVSGGVPQFKGINLKDLHIAYRQFCKGETVASSPFDIAAVIEFYNRAVADLPDPAKLKGGRLPQVSSVLAGDGARFAEVFDQDQRRVFVPLAQIPQHVQNAFIAAEDKRFHQHRGIDERALIRAFLGNLAQSGRPQGGSTITHQVVKNLLVGDELSYERKMREMIVAARLERIMTKQEILELYLNSAYLGRASWGVELAARSYFGKPAKELALAEAALLAGLTKGPNYYNPDRHPQRARERLVYVLGRMSEDGMITPAEAKRAMAGQPTLVAFERPARRDTGFHFVDQVAREARGIAGVDGLTARAYTVRSTINPVLQRAAEAALQEGLARYELGAGRAQFYGAETNLADAIRRLEADGSDEKPAWQRALESARLPLYDVHWPAAIMLELPSSQSQTARVGLADGRIVPLSGGRLSLRALKVHDVVLVKLTEQAATASKGKTKTQPAPKATARAELRTRPSVQGTAIVLENRTGRILAMAGGFSYPLSQLNRATQSVRQPGSALKPVSFLAALQRGLQPNTLVRDEPLTLPPIDRQGGYVREQDYWSPRNYDHGAGGVITLRRALENSRNLATANLLQGGIDITPALSLDRVCALAIEAQIYKECSRYYPFVLGAQAVRPIDLAAFFSAIATEGQRPTPHTIDSIEIDGEAVYRHPESSSTRIGSADQASFFQLKSMMQGVLRRGTAGRIAALAPYVAGKTGTTDNENDAWFIGFTNEVTVAVWIGYDNADGRRRTLGGGTTGGSVAVPIFETIIQAVWAHHAPRTLLAGPSAEARRHLVAVRVDPNSGGPSEAAAGVEYIRRDASGRPIDAQYRIVSQAEADILIDGYAPVRPGDGGGFFSFFGRGFAPWQPAQPAPPPQRGLFGAPAPQQQRPGGGYYGAPQPQRSPYDNRRPLWNNPG